MFNIIRMAPALASMSTLLTLVCAALGATTITNKLRELFRAINMGKRGRVVLALQNPSRPDCFVII